MRVTPVIMGLRLKTVLMGDTRLQSLPIRLVLRLLIAVILVTILVRNRVVQLVDSMLRCQLIRPVLLLLTTVEHVTKTAILLTVVRVATMLRYLRTIFVLR